MNKPTLEGKDLYSEKYKILMKGIKDDTNRWKDRAFSWFGRINIVKITMLPKAIFRKKNGAGEIRLPDLRLYCKATIVKTT